MQWPILALTRENLTLLHAKYKGAYETAQPSSLVSAFIFLSEMDNCLNFIHAKIEYSSYSYYLLLSRVDFRPYLASNTTDGLSGDMTSLTRLPHRDAFNSFASRADPYLLGVYSVCLWKYDISEPILVDMKLISLFYVPTYQFISMINTT